MKLTVLTDNNTYIDQYYLGEPGLCYYLEDGEERLLFDLGYSDVFVQNANAMGIPLETVRQIVFSHGHNDHTGGMRFLPPEVRGCRIIAHKNVLEPTFDLRAAGCRGARFPLLPVSFKGAAPDQPAHLVSRPDPPAASF